MATGYDYFRPGGVAVRHETLCPVCHLHTGTFFARHGVATSVYHCCNFTCGVFFVAASPDPDFHSVNITSTKSSPAQQVSVVVTPAGPAVMTRKGVRSQNRADLAQVSENDSNAAASVMVGGNVWHSHGQALCTQSVVHTLIVSA